MPIRTFLEYGLVVKLNMTKQKQNKNSSTTHKKVVEKPTIVTPIVTSSEGPSSPDISASCNCCTRRDRRFAKLAQRKDTYKQYEELISILRNEIEFLTELNRETRSKLDLLNVGRPGGEFETVLQSSEDVQASTDSGDSQVNIRFREQVPASFVKAAKVVDTSFLDGYTPSDELGSFLNRPVLIYTKEWAEGTSISDTFDPWYEYFNNTQIKKKLDNYAYINCKLKLKVLINSSPFYYSCAMLSYKPLVSFNTLDSNSVDAKIHLMQRSQRPHLYIYPQTNQGGEMELPFFYHKNWLKVSVAQEFRDMGTCHLTSFGVLQNANTVTGDSVTIQIFAYAENVKLSGPTVEVSMQSGNDEHSDEYDGKISAPASAVAAAAGALSSVPMLKPYMLATQTVASSIAGVAKYFGFTKVPNIRDVEPYKSMPFHGMSSSEISQPMEKLTLDPKNELTIDPRTVGIDGADELSIKHLTSKESFIDSFNWDGTQLPDSLLYAARISNVYSYVNGIQVMSTPLSYFSAPFKYWRGDIKFRIKFLCTKFHRGRVRISWDPVGDIITDADNNTVVFNQIVDITSETDIEFCIPYMSSQAWLNSQTLTADNSGIASYTHDSLVDNGVMTVRVFTMETSPVADAAITGLVYVRAGDNFEVACPTQIPNYTLYELQSGDDLVIENPTCYDMGSDKQKPHDERYKIYMGEQIVSFRQLLRRSVFTRTQSISQTTCQVLKTRLLMSRFPLYYGYDPNGINSAKGTLAPLSDYRFNYVKPTLFNWIGAAFIGMRGSSEWQFNLNSPGVAKTMKFNRFFGLIAGTDYYSVSTINATANRDQYAHSYCVQFGEGAAGTSLTNQLTQTGCCASIPMYNQNRMVSTDPAIRTGGSIKDDSRNDHVRIDIVTTPERAFTDTAEGVTIEMYHNIGTDFNFFFFINVPMLQTLAIPDPTV